MAGNSQRRGATRRTGTKKGAVVGSGGEGRQKLEGRGPTPKAEDRPGHSAHRRARSADKRAQGRSGSGSGGAGSAGRQSRFGGGRRAQLGAGGAAGGDPRDGPARAAVPRRRRSSAGRDEARGRAGHPAAGDHARRPRPDQRRSGAPRDRAQGPAVRVRRRGGPSRRGVRCGFRAADRRARRCDRSAQPGGDGAIGCGVRCGRGRDPRAALRRDDRVGVEVVGRGGVAAAGRAGDEPDALAGGRAAQRLHGDRAGDGR